MVAIVLAAAPAGRAEVCTLKRGINVVVGRSVVPLGAGAALDVAAPRGEFSAGTVEGRPIRVSRRYLATACVEGPLFTDGASPPPPSSPSSSPSSSSLSSSSPSSSSSSSSSSPSPSSSSSLRPPLPTPTPCKPSASRLLRQARALARSGASLDVVVAAAAAARVSDPRCIEAHGWLAWAQLAAGDARAALRTWDELWAAWVDVPAWAQGLRPRATQAALRGRAAAVRALPSPALPSVDDTPSSAATGPCAAALRARAPGAAPTTAVRLAAVGDVQLGRGWPAAQAALPPDEGRGFLDAVAPALQGAALTVANLGTVLADDGDSGECGPEAVVAGACAAFRAPTWMARRLAEAGLDVVSLANDHSGDFGPAGLRATTDALAAARLVAVGPAGRTASVVVDGVRIGLAAFGRDAAEPGLRDVEGMQKVVVDLDAAHDIVVVQFDGGAEGAAHRVPDAAGRSPGPARGDERGDVRSFARAAVDAGADVVVGSGPRGLRGLERYRGRLIAYSLGTFSSWQTFLSSGTGALAGVLQVELDCRGVALAASFVPTRAERSGRPVPDDSGAALALLRRLSALDFGDAFFDEQGRWRRGQAVQPAVPAPADGAPAASPPPPPPPSSPLSLSSSSPSSSPRTCTLRRETLLFREGAFVAVAAGTVLTLGERGPGFTVVDTDAGPAKIANGLLDRCR